MSDRNVKRPHLSSWLYRIYVTRTWEENLRGRHDVSARPLEPRLLLTLLWPVLSTGPLAQKGRGSLSLTPSSSLLRTEESFRRGTHLYLIGWDCVTHRDTEVENSKRLCRVKSDRHVYPKSRHTPSQGNY